MLDIIYEIKDSETEKWHAFNGVSFEPRFDKYPYYISGFSANIRIKNNYSSKVKTHYYICYTLLSNENKWTSIVCNGERLEITKYAMRNYFSKIIIYVPNNYREVQDISGSLI